MSREHIYKLVENKTVHWSDRGLKINWSISCCVTQHGRVVLPVLSDTQINKGEFLSQGSVRDSLEDVRNGISKSDLSFPVCGSSDQDVHGALYDYVPIISSPGEAYVINREPDETSTDILVAMIFSCWPMVILSLVFSILVGFVICLLQ